MFKKMNRSENSVEYEITQRQLAIKETNHKSLLTHIKSIWNLYGLPPMFQLFNSQPSKAEWKGMVYAKPQGT